MRRGLANERAQGRGREGGREAARGQAGGGRAPRAAELPVCLGAEKSHPYGRAPRPRPAPRTPLPRPPFRAAFSFSLSFSFGELGAVALPHAQWGWGRGRGWGRGLLGAHGAVIFSSAASTSRGTERGGGHVLRLLGRAAWVRDPNFATTLSPLVIRPPAPCPSGPSDPHPVRGRLQHSSPILRRSPACARAARARLRPGRSVSLPVCQSVSGSPGLGLRSSSSPELRFGHSLAPSLPSPFSLYENICKFPKKPLSRAARGWRLHRVRGGAAE